VLNQSLGKGNGSDLIPNSDELKLACDKGVLEKMKIGLLWLLLLIHMRGRENRIKSLPKM
jgi:hypothetical protein